MIRQMEGDGQRKSRQKEGEIDKQETEESNGSRREERGGGGRRGWEIANVSEVFFQF